MIELTDKASGKKILFPKDAILVREPISSSVPVTIVFGSSQFQVTEDYATVKAAL